MNTPSWINDRNKKRKYVAKAQQNVAYIWLLTRNATKTPVR